MSKGSNEERRCEIVGKIHALYSENDTAVVVPTIFLPRARLGRVLGTVLLRYFVFLLFPGRAHSPQYVFIELTQSHVVQYSDIYSTSNGNNKPAGN